MIYARASDRVAAAPLPEEKDLQELSLLVEDFPRKLEEKTGMWKDRLKRIQSDEGRAVLWGSGSKAVSFLTTLDVRDEIKFVVDINPYRQGTYMAGTGHEIVAPSFLKEYRPHVIIIMNAIYRDEIAADVTEMGLSPDLLCV
jgi:hypothetical protein